ncbi:hypothetical protein [Salipiger sp. IMCC34102]|nr:hypothetical protein [Salipiger sp. IMCC34102]
MTELSGAAQGPSPLPQAPLDMPRQMLERRRRPWLASLLAHLTIKSA